MVLCFFAGFLVDRVFGIRLGSIIFSLVCLVGQLIFALGMISAVNRRRVSIHSDNVPMIVPEPSACLLHFVL